MPKFLLDKLIKEFDIHKFTHPLITGQEHYSKSLGKLYTWSHNTNLKPRIEDWQNIWRCAYELNSDIIKNLMKELHPQWIHSMKNYTQSKNVKQKFDDFFKLILGENPYGAN